MIKSLTICYQSVSNLSHGLLDVIPHRNKGIFPFNRICLLTMERESVCVKNVNQRIGVSDIATAFRIISRFCLNRIWLEELNQLCPRITGMTLEESLQSRGQSRDSPINCVASISSIDTKPKLASRSTPLLSWYLDPLLQSGVRSGPFWPQWIFKSFFFNDWLLSWLLMNGYQLFWVATCVPKV